MSVPGAVFLGIFRLSFVLPIRLSQGFVGLEKYQPFNIDSRSKSIYTEMLPDGPFQGFRTSGTSAFPFQALRLFLLKGINYPAHLSLPRYRVLEVQDAIWLYSIGVRVQEWTKHYLSPVFRLAIAT